MGRKAKRKTQWRRLSLEDESSVTDSSSSSGPEGEVVGSQSSEESSSSGVSTGDRRPPGSSKFTPRNKGVPRGGRPSGPTSNGKAPSSANNSHYHHHYHHHHFAGGGSGGGGGGMGSANAQLPFYQSEDFYGAPPSAGFYCGSGQQAQGSFGTAASRGGSGQGDGPAPNRGYGYRRQNRNERLNRQYQHQHNSNFHQHQSGSYPGSEKRFLFLAETCYYNDKEYTKIQTPHQDLLFKKGWLSSRRKDLDELRIPDKTAEAVKTAQEQNSDKNVPGGDAEPRAETEGQPSKTQGKESEDVTVPPTVAVEEQFVPAAWTADQTFLGEYYPPQSAVFIPCDVTDSMGQYFPGMMVQQPLYAPFQWAFVPVPIPFVCYDKYPDYAGLSAGMSSLEISEEVDPVAADDPGKGKGSQTGAADGDPEETKLGGMGGDAGAEIGVKIEEVVEQDVKN